jgi:hypothetical protein
MSKKLIKINLSKNTINIYSCFQNKIFNYLNLNITQLFHQIYAINIFLKLGNIKIKIHI